MRHSLLAVDSKLFCFFGTLSCYTKLCRNLKFFRVISEVSPIFNHFKSNEFRSLRY